MSLFTEELCEKILSTHVFFDNQKMAELVAQTLIDKEGLVVNSECDSRTARCPHPYCPSSIFGGSMMLEDIEYFYLWHVPHFHKSTIYPGNPSHLSSFLQTVLSTHSGLCYLNERSTLLQSNPSSSSLLSSILQSKRTEFIEGCKESLRSSAVNDFGQSIHDDIVKLTNELDGM